MSKHTPGRWYLHLSRGGLYCVESKNTDGSTCAIVGKQNEFDDMGSIYTREDANLIAAAPDLLEALETFIAHFDQHQKPMTEDEKVQNDLDWFDAVDAACKAIARAKGESQ